MSKYPFNASKYCVLYSLAFQDLLLSIFPKDFQKEETSKYPGLGQVLMDFGFTFSKKIIYRG